MLIDEKPYPFFQGNDGLLYHFDMNRSKWLSVNRETLSFGINAKNITGNRYMSTGKLYSNLSGQKLLRDITITGISVQTGNFQCTFNVHIHKNGNTNSIYSVNLFNEASKVVDNINFDAYKDDFIQMSIENSDIGVSYPEISVEYSWRTTY